MVVYEDWVAVKVEDEIVEDCVVDTVREFVWNMDPELSDEGASGQPEKSQASTEQQPVKLFASQTYHC